MYVLVNHLLTDKGPISGGYGPRSGDDTQCPRGRGSSFSETVRSTYESIRLFGPDLEFRQTSGLDRERCEGSREGGSSREDVGSRTGSRPRYQIPVVCSRLAHLGSDSCLVTDSGRHPGVYLPSERGSKEPGSPSKDDSPEGRDVWRSDIRDVGVEVVDLYRRGMVRCQLFVMSDLSDPRHRRPPRPQSVRPRMAERP